jgi:uncharacterized protein YjiS (DUF1127 family)
MPSSRLQVTIALWQPLHLRVWRRVVDGAAAVGPALRHAWHVHAQRVRTRRAWRDLSGLSAHTLRDIGAPDWAVLDAADRSDAARRRAQDLSHWRV